MASLGYDATDGGKTGYKVLPLVISEEYGKLPPAKLSLWDGKTRSWVQVLNEKLGSLIGVRYAIRNSGVHLMAIQQLDTPQLEPLDGPSKPQFGRVASLVFGKPPKAGPILYNVKKVPRDTRRPLDGRCLRLDFRILDGGFVFGVDITGLNASNPLGFASGAKLALKGMLDAKSKVLSFQNEGGSIWLRLETSQTLEPEDEPLTVLWSGKSTWLGVNERILPWIDIDNVETNSRSAELSSPNTTANTQVPTITHVTKNSHTSTTHPKTMPGEKTPDENTVLSTLELTSKPVFSFPNLGTSLDKVAVFYWEPEVQNWTRILPEAAGQTFGLSLNLRLLLNGIEFNLLHQVPGFVSSSGNSGVKTTQVLGSMKWYLGEEFTNNIQYHIQMKESDGGHRLPVFYINLPEIFKMELAEKGGEIFDSMIDVAHQIFLEAKHKTQAESYSNRWICVKTTTTQNLSFAMEILQREGSPYTLCRSSVVPRRSRT
ncbi:hypothetical protein TWF703_007593 [Orbilia oligospora]|uniref:Uncharacterized protein n=1 Tax=Orbilia oligospora TaxID=2813651 RepID=A0A7C8NN35_ORBOL|nr:hypothetical protein TWF703_007593 [Orbilia oligospora]